MTEREIYRESFGLDPRFEDRLFKAPIKTLKVGNKTVSQLFLLPCNIVKNGKPYKAQYIYAVCTKKDSRKKGYMEQLLKDTLSHTSDILILRPATEDLIKYYKKFGFKEFTATDGENPNLYLEPLDIFKNLADSDGKTNEGNLTLMALNCPIDLSGLSFPYTMP